MPIGLDVRNARHLLDHRARRPAYASNTQKEALPEILEAKNETALRSDSRDRQAQPLNTEKYSLSSLNATDPGQTNQIREHAPSGELYKTRQLNAEAFGSLNEEANSYYQTSMMANSSSGRYGKAELENPTPVAAEELRTGVRSAAGRHKGPSKPTKRLEGEKARDQLFRSLSRSVKKVERESRQAQQEQMVFMKQDV